MAIWKTKLFFMIKLIFDRWNSFMVSIEKLKKSINQTIIIMIIRKSWSKDYWWSSMIEIQKKSMSINFLYLDIFIMNEWMSIKTNRFLPFENIRIQFSYVIYVRFIYPSSSSSSPPLSLSAKTINFVVVVEVIFFEIFLLTIMLSQLCFACCLLSKQQTNNNIQVKSTDIQIGIYIFFSWNSFESQSSSKSNEERLWLF